MGNAVFRGDVNAELERQENDRRNREREEELRQRKHELEMAEVQQRLDLLNFRERHRVEQLVREREEALDAEIAEANVALRQAEIEGARELGEARNQAAAREHEMAVEDGQNRVAIAEALRVNTDRLILRRNTYSVNRCITDVKQRLVELNTRSYHNVLRFIEMPVHIIIPQKAALAVFINDITLFTNRTVYCEAELTGIGAATDKIREMKSICLKMVQDVTNLQNDIDKCWKLAEQNNNHESVYLNPDLVTKLKDRMNALTDKESELTHIPIDRLSTSSTGAIDALTDV